MKRTKILVDVGGPYVEVEGSIVRPATETQFSPGRIVSVYHFNGSSICGVGKEGVLERGKYNEYWDITKLNVDEYRFLSGNTHTVRELREAYAATDTNQTQVQVLDRVVPFRAISGLVDQIEHSDIDDDVILNDLIPILSVPTVSHPALSQGPCEVVDQLNPTRIVRL